MPYIRCQYDSEGKGTIGNLQKQRSTFLTPVLFLIFGDVYD